MGILPYQSQEERIQSDINIVIERRFLENRFWAFPGVDENGRYIHPESFLADDGNHYSYDDFHQAMGYYPLVQRKDGIWFSQHLALEQEKFVKPFDDQCKHLLHCGFNHHPDLSEDYQENNRLLKEYDQKHGFVPRWIRGEGVYSHERALAASDYVPSWVRRSLKYQGALCACCDQKYRKSGHRQTKNSFTIHHLFPRCYFKHRSKDTTKKHKVILLCRRCHDKYEAKAYDFKQTVALKYGFDMEGYGELPLARVKGIARRILSQNHRTPPEHVMTPEQLEAHYVYMAEVLGREKVVFEDLPTFKDLKMPPRPPEELTCSKVAKAIPEEEWEDFVESWRRHFIETMKPKNFSKFWTEKDKLEFLSCENI